MHEERIAGGALIAGTAMGLVTMGLHPTGSELLRDYAAEAPQNLVVHGLAIAAVPLLLFGTRAIGGRLRAANASALAGLGGSVYLVASFAAVIAAVASGLVGPMLAERLLSASDPEAAIWRVAYRSNGMLNQGFAAVYVVGLATAILIWSIGIWRTRAFARALGAVGAVIGSGLLVLMSTGPYLDVHTFGLIVLAQAIWMIGIGIALARRPRAQSDP